MEYTIKIVNKSTSTQEWSSDATSSTIEQELLSGASSQFAATSTVSNTFDIPIRILQKDKQCDITLRYRENVEPQWDLYPTTEGVVLDQQDNSITITANLK